MPGQVMTDDPESIALRPTVVDGQTMADDFEVIWRGMQIGRMMKQPDGPHWWWGCNVYGHTPSPNDRGPAINFKDCQVRFKLAWSRIRPELTEATIAVAMRHADELRQRQPVGVVGVGDGVGGDEESRIAPARRDARVDQRVLRVDREDGPGGARGSVPDRAAGAGVVTCGMRRFVA